MCDLAFLQETRHLHLPLVVPSGEIGEERHQVFKLHPCAITRIEPEGLAQGPGIELGTGRDQHETAAPGPLRPEHFLHGGVKLRGRAAPRESFHQFLQPRPRHAPEKGQEDPLQSLRSEHLGQNQKGQEEHEIQPAQRFAPQNPVAEEQLGVPGDESLIEIKESNPALPVFLRHENFLVVAVPL